MLNILVVGSSGGIGRALHEQSISDGNNVIGISRSQDGLDITNEQSILSALGRVQDIQFDKIFIATGELASEGFEPEKTIDRIDPQNSIMQFQVNALGPILLLKHLKRNMLRRKPVFIGVLSAKVGSISDNNLGGWYSYRASKAALNQFIRTYSIELSRTHPESTCVALHPGTIRTSFTKNYHDKYLTQTPKECAKNLLKLSDEIKFTDTGSFFDYSGQKIDW